MIDQPYTYPPYTYPHLPSHIKDAIDEWAAFGRRQGGFVMAVLENDLLNAFSHADESNRQPKVMQDIIWYVHNETPMYSHGSAERCEKWPTRIGLPRALP